MRPAFGAPSTGFGGGFGSTPSFGNNNNNRPGVGFGTQPATGFGAPAPAFGAQGSSSFGTSGTASPFGRSTFGGAQPTTGATPFGSTGSAFGGGSAFGAAKTGSPGAFGSSPFGKPAGGGFGTTSATGFGTSTANGSGISAPFGNSFGASAAPAFGGGGGTGFGFGNAGASQTSAFGSAPTPVFGASANTFGGGFGTTPAFGGAPAAPAFGAAAPAFGASAPAPAFGSSAPAFGSATSAFGSSAPAFGSTAPAFGAAATPGFGGATGGFGAPTTSFGSTGTTGFGAGPSFGAPSSAFSTFGGGPVGTSGTPFNPLQVKEVVQKNGITNTVTTKLQAFSGMPGFESKSLEELRWEDYQKGVKSGNAPAATFGGSAFGSAPSTSFGAPTGGNSFGTTGGGFGTTPGGGFGTTPGGGFGTTGGAFGSNAGGGFGTNAGGGFGAPATGGFGGASFGSAAKPAFGTGSAPSAFGSPGAGAFGTQPANKGFSFGGASTTAPSFGFGGSQNTSNSFGGGGFSQPAQPSTFGATQPSGGFGTGGFGSNAAPSAFGTTQNTTGFNSITNSKPATQTSGFGFGNPSQPLSGFSTTAPSGSNFAGFGTTPATGGFGAGGFGSGGFGSGGFGSGGFGSGGFGAGGFGAGGFGTSTTGGSLGGFGGFNQPNNGQFNVGGQPNNQALHIQNDFLRQPDLDVKIEFLKKKKDEMEIHVKDEKPVSSITLPGGSPTVENSLSTARTPSHASISLNVRQTSKSKAKIIPRGYRGDIPIKQSPDSDSLTAKSLDITKNKDVKRLVIAPSQLSLRNTSTSISLGDAIAETPSKVLSTRDISAGHSRETHGSVEEKQTLKQVSLYGDKTGLTPGATSSPNASMFIMSPSAHSKRVAFNPSTVDDESDLYSDQLGDRNEFYSAEKPRPKSVFDELPVYPDNALTGPPTLTNKEYGTIPDMKILQSLEDSDLSHIKNFTVYRKGYGQIVWENESDVRGLDLDSIVKIEHKEVSVYGDSSTYGNDGCSIAPPRGHGLNKPATITLYNIFPKDPQKSADYEEKLRKFCDSSDAEFLSFNVLSGDWVFYVKHFSKYKLLDSDDEDESNNSTGSAPPIKPAPASSVSPAQVIDSTTITTFGAHSDIKKLEITFYPSRGQRGSQETKIDYRDFQHQHSVTHPVFRGLERIPHLPRHLALKANQRKRPANSILVKQNKLGASHFSLQTYPELPVVLSESSVPLSQQIIEASRSITSKFDTQAAPETSLSNRRFNSDVYKQAVKNQKEFRDKVLSEIDKSLSSQVKHENERDNKYFDSSKSPSLNMLRSFKQNYFNMIGVTPEKEDLSRLTGDGKAIPSCMQRPIREYSLAMGRSCRVGFNAFGHLAHCGPPIFSTENSTSTIPVRRRVIIEKIDPLRWVSKSFGLSSLSSGLNNTDFDSTYTNPLSTIFNHSRRFIDEGSYTPIWKAPSCKPIEIAEYSAFLSIINEIQQQFDSRATKGIISSSHPDWFIGRAVSLIYASVGQEAKVFKQNLELPEEAHDILPFYEDTQGFSPSQVERRQTMLTAWFRSLTPIECIENSEDSYSRIYSLLTSQRINEAVSQAEDSGLFRLATLLSQLNSDRTICHLIRYQLDIWKAQEADCVMPSEILSIYRLIAADMFPSDVWEDSILSDIGWARAIGTLYLYSDESNPLKYRLSNAIAVYDDALHCGWVDSPCSAYINDDETIAQNVSYPSVYNGVYCLLKLLYPSPNVDFAAYQVLDSRGYSRDVLDYRGVYILLILLENMGYFTDAVEIGNIVRNHFIAQLLGEGLWEWALYVSLQISDNRVRNNLAKDIIFRYSGQLMNWEDSSGSKEKFCIEDLGMPAEWLYEASAYRRVHDRDYYPAVNYLLQCDGNISALSFARNLVLTRITPATLTTSASTATESLASLFHLIGEKLEFSKQMTDERASLNVLVKIESRREEEVEAVLEYLRFRKNLQQSISKRTADVLKLQELAYLAVDYVNRAIREC